MMSLTFGLFTQVSGSGPLGPLVKCRFLFADVWFYGAERAYFRGVVVHFEG